MARVNHKKVKQLIAETRGKITDRQFFTSRILAGHFEDMAAAQSKRYHYNRRVRVSLYWSPKDSNVASTNNMSITINTGNKLVTRVKGRENRYQVVCGLFAHELGHVLYTDFLASQSYGNSMARYHWFPDAPKLMKPQISGMNLPCGTMSRKARKMRRWSFTLRITSVMFWRTAILKTVC